MNIANFADTLPGGSWCKRKLGVNMTNLSFAIGTLSLVVLAGCATNTGVVKISDNLYMIGKQGGWESSGSAVRVELYKEAGQYCSNMGKKFVPVSGQSDDQGPGKHATAEIHFKCE